MSVTLHTTMGDIKIEVFCEDTPVCAYNFLALCASGYYNNCIFHRNIPGFIVQTGDPTNKGKGGQSIYGHEFEDEIREKLTHNRRGVVSMANVGPHTNKSQFFITYKALPSLDGKYSIFGQVLHGNDVLKAMEVVPGEGERPITPIKIRYITIHANPLADIDGETA
mmetsp:Transcript_16626/g.18494  ORF Transcript_16626/g.18494 Transcript_16626/m.18494 type:complete len:166 (-) Transcript_16626:223-720(-)